MHESSTGNWKEGTAACIYTQGFFPSCQNLCSSAEMPRQIFPTIILNWPFLQWKHKRVTKVHAAAIKRMERRKKKKKALQEKKKLHLPTLLFPTDSERKILPLSSAFKAAIFSSFSIFTERRKKGTKTLGYYLVHQTQLNRGIPKAHSQGGHAETEPLEELNHPCEADLFFIRPPWEASARLTTRGMGPNSTSPLPPPPRSSSRQRSQQGAGI